MKTKTFGKRNKFGTPVPTQIEFEDGTKYNVPENPGGGDGFYVIPLPDGSVVTVRFEDIILEGI